MRYKTKEAQDAPQWRELPKPCHEQLYAFFRLVSIRVWTAYVPCLRPQSRPSGVLYLIHVFAYHNNKDRETRKMKKKNQVPLTRVSPPFGVRFHYGGFVEMISH